ncbi:MAG: DEAD/DEAH box helicase, partial [Thermofilaceae archaeon]
MISYATKEYTKEEVLRLLHPLVAEWFSRRYKDLTPPQRLGILPIYSRKNVLISSPTGTGKTLTAFLVVISELIKLALEGKLEDEVYAVYVSPLRALNNDIFRNLEEPLSEIRKLAEEEGVKLPEIRHAVRTGDTPSNDRQKMLRKPPHILITTPETLAITLVFVVGRSGDRRGRRRALR